MIFAADRRTKPTGNRLAVGFIVRRERRSNNEINKGTGGKGIGGRSGNVKIAFARIRKTELAIPCFRDT